VIGLLLYAFYGIRHGRGEAQSATASGA
jgi:hypothetical protein